MLRFTPRYTCSGTLSGDFPPWFSTLLLGRGIDTSEKAQRFLNPLLSDLHDPFRMQDMDRAVSLIRQTLEKHGRIVVYGDYDVDGICATSIMTENLRALGADVRYRLPDRASEGYGLHREIISELAPGTDLLITVDCGITNHEEVLYARSLGLTVVVTDHHQPAETPSPADAVLNPLLGDYPFPKLCGAGVALKVVQALRGTEAVPGSLDLAALATVADVVPLIDENRIIVATGLKAVESTLRPGLKELIRLAGLKAPLTASDIAFRIAPRLNAGGRLEDASQCVELLLSRDPAAAAGIAEHLEQLNSLRQETERTIMSEALKQLTETVNFRTDRIIVVSGSGWNNGIIGLVAGKLCEKYHFPTVVLSDHGGESVGSCRSVPGVNIHAMLSACKDLFVRFGGHEQAAGLTVRTELIPEMKRRLNAAISSACDESCFIPDQEYDLPFRLSDTSLETVSVLELLEPCGYGNPAPLFLFRDCEVQERYRIGRDRSHLRMNILQGKETRNCIGFSMGSLADESWTRVDMIASPERNEYNGRVELQLQLKAVRPAEGACDLPPTDALFPAFLQDLTLLAAKQEADPSPERINRSRAVALLRKPLGTLLLTADRVQALSLAQEAGCELLPGKIRDNRGFSSVLWLPSFSGLSDTWKTVILHEAELWPGMTALVRSVCPNADLLILPSAEKVPVLLKDISTERQLLGRIWQAVRGASRTPAAIAGMTGTGIPQVLVALTAFRDLGLISAGKDLNSYSIVPDAKKSSLENSPLICYLRRILPDSDPGSERKSV